MRKLDATFGLAPLPKMGLRHGLGWRDRFLKNRDGSEAYTVPPSRPTSMCNPRLHARPTNFVKYGKRGHMQAALHKGKLRISPASAYNDSWLNSAIRDNESQTRIDLDPISGLVRTVSHRVNVSA